MKAVVQRVKEASVFVENKLVSQIGAGFLVFLGIAKDDREKEFEWMVKKISNLRIMSDKKNKMNKLLKEVDGEMLVVSQFTLLADCRRGNRPSFTEAAGVEKAEKFYNLFVERIAAQGLKVKAGVFQEMMAIKLLNDGPVTIILEKKCDRI